MPNPTVDLSMFSQIVTRSQQLRSDYSTRNQQLQEIQKMFLMEWDKKPVQPNLKYTISPTARNAALGAARLLYASDPVFSVPHDKNDATLREKFSPIEKAAAALWDANTKIRGTPAHKDIALSAVLYGEVHAGVTSTEDLLLRAQGTQDKATIARLTRISKQTPYLFEVYDPLTGYPERDSAGMTGYYREQAIEAGKVLSIWGKLAEDQGLKDRKAVVTYCDWWDDAYHIVWILGKGDPLLMEEHGLPVVPIVAITVDGSELFSKPEQASQPFLYTLYKSGMWERENLMLTMMYSNMFAIAANPTFASISNDETGLSVDWSVPGGVISMRPGEDFRQVVKSAIDPEMFRAWEIAQSQAGASTIYPQTLGEPVGGNAPYSMVALLHQAGRLPLVGPQKLGGLAVASLMEIAFKLWYAKGGTNVIASTKGAMTLKKADIPEDLIIDARLEVDMPMDDRQNAVVATQLSGGLDPLSSKRFARENYLHMGQSEDMQLEIWAERQSEQAFQIGMQRDAQKALQPQQTGPGQMPIQQSGQQPGGNRGQPGYTQAQVPPEMQAEYSRQMMAQQQGAPGPQQAQPGLPMTEPQAMPGQAPGPGGG